MLQEENSVALTRQFFTDIEQLVSATVDIDEILALASKPCAFEFNDIRPLVSRGECRIAVASDKCFRVCYQDNIALLRMFGADVLRFSPLAGSTLPPDIGGIYIPGTCLTEYAEEDLLS